MIELRLLLPNFFHSNAVHQVFNTRQIESVRNSHHFFFVLYSLSFEKLAHSNKGLSQNYVGYVLRNPLNWDQTALWCNLKFITNTKYGKGVLDVHEGFYWVICSNSSIHQIEFYPLSLVSNGGIIIGREVGRRCRGCSANVTNKAIWNLLWYGLVAHRNHTILVWRRQMKYIGEYINSNQLPMLVHMG